MDFLGDEIARLKRKTAPSSSSSASIASADRTNTAAVAASATDAPASTRATKNDTPSASASALASASASKYIRRADLAAQQRAAYLADQAARADAREKARETKAAEKSAYESARRQGLAEHRAKTAAAAASAASAASAAVVANGEHRVAQGAPSGAADAADAEGVASAERADEDDPVVDQGAALVPSAKRAADDAQVDTPTPASASAAGPERLKRRKLTIDDVYTVPADDALPLHHLPAPDRAAGDCIKSTRTGEPRGTKAELPTAQQLSLDHALARDDTRIAELCQNCFTLLRCAVRVWELDLASDSSSSAAAAAAADARGHGRSGSQKKGQEQQQEQQLQQEQSRRHALYLAARTDLAPLLHRLRRQSLPRDVVSKVAELCSALQAAKYMQAGQAHLSLSVGTHAWPTRGNIGVGIHERARPKFEERRERERLRAIEEARRKQQERRAAKAKASTAGASNGERQDRSDRGEQQAGGSKEEEEKEEEEDESEDEEAWKLQGDAGQAYMLADDATRRWLQGLRRLVTHFERRE